LSVRCDIAFACVLPAAAAALERNQEQKHQLARSPRPLKREGGTSRGDPSMHPSIRPTDRQDNATLPCAHQGLKDANVDPFFIQQWRAEKTIS